MKSKQEEIAQLKERLKQLQDEVEKDFEPREFYLTSSYHASLNIPQHNWLVFKTMPTNLPRDYFIKVREVIEETPPEPGMVRREVTAFANVYGCGVAIYHKKESADRNVTGERIACVELKGYYWLKGESANE